MKLRICLIICFLSICSLQHSCAKVCNALVLEAGGDKGAYEAGALSVLVKNATNPQNRMWDVVSGVSIGSILTGFIAQYDIGDEVKMADELVNLWEEIKASDIYKSWPGGLVEGLLYRSSLFDESPADSLLKKYMPNQAKRKIAIAACDADTPEYKVFNESLSAEELQMAIKCSSAFPVAFPYVNFKNSTYMDGGLLNSLNIGSAVERCREIVDDDSEINVDTILISNSILSPVDASKDSALSILFRSYQLINYAQNIIILTAAEKEFPKVNFRYTVIPTAPLPSAVVPLGFDHDQISKMVAMGVQDATAVIEKGEKQSHYELLEKAKNWLRNSRKQIFHAQMQFPQQIVTLQQEIKEHSKKVYEKQVKSHQEL